MLSDLRDFFFCSALGLLTSCRYVENKSIPESDISAPAYTIWLLTSTFFFLPEAIIPPAMLHSAGCITRRAAQYYENMRYAISAWNAAIVYNS